MAHLGNLTKQEVIDLLEKKKTLLQEMLDEQRTFRCPSSSDYSPEVWISREEYILHDYNQLCNLASRMISQVTSEIDLIQLHLSQMNMPNQ